MLKNIIICLSLFTAAACDRALGELPACAAEGERHNCPPPPPPPPDCGTKDTPPCPGTTKGTIKIKWPKLPNP